MRSLFVVGLLVIFLIPFVYADSSLIQPADAETKTLQIEAHVDDGKAAVGSDFRYEKDALLVLKKDGRPRAAIIGKFGQSDVDLSGLLVRSEGEKTLVKLEKPSGVGSLTAKTDPNFAIFVPNTNGGAGVYVCSGAKTLQEVTKDCACKIEIKGPLPLASSASVYTINGVTAFLTDDRQNYVIYGLTGTGVGLLELESVSTQSGLDLWDDTDSQRKGVNQDVGFYAQYYNLQSFLLIQNADCKISLPNGQSGGQMTWNSAKKRYEFSSKFSQPGDFTWSATCTDTNQNNNPASKTDDLVISSDTDSAPKVTLITPNQSQSINSNTINFACSATDDQKVESMSLYLDNMSKPFLTKTFSGKSGLLSTDVNGVPQGTHNWTCEVTDSATQKSRAPERTFKVTSALQLACTSDWTCDSWSPCIEGRQIRQCTDRKLCFNQQEKPEQEQRCDASVLPTTIRASTPRLPSSGPTDLSPVYSLLVTLLILVWLLFLFFKRRKKRKV